jgi:hypothetical protein
MAGRAKVRKESKGKVDQLRVGQVRASNLEAIQQLTVCGELQSAYFFMCDRINEYGFLATKEGDFFCATTKGRLNRNEILSILRRDLKSKMPYLSSSRANELILATIQALIKNLTKSSENGFFKLDPQKVESQLKNNK